MTEDLALTTSPSDLRVPQITILSRAPQTASMVEYVPVPDAAPLGPPMSSVPAGDWQKCLTADGRRALTDFAQRIRTLSATDVDRREVFGA